MKYMLICLFVLSGSAIAQPYAGVAIGGSKAKLPDQSRECADCSVHLYDNTFAQAQVYAGYRRGAWAVEIGTGRLSKYRTHNVRPPRPADIYQEIDTRRLYVQAMRFVSIGAGWEAFGAFGFARVTMKNHEYGYNDPSLQFVEQVNYDTRTKPMIGAGVQYRIDKTISARLELNRVNNVGVSYWTLHQDVKSIWLGVHSNF